MMLNTEQAAARRGVSTLRIRRWVQYYGLRATRTKMMMFIDEQHLRKFVPPNRGPKTKSPGTSGDGRGGGMHRTD